MKRIYQDFFCHFDILAMLCLLGSGVIVLFVSGFTLLLLPWFITGLFVFIVSEYLTHRFLFHLKPPGNPLLLRFLKRIHYDHHLYPHDLKLLFLPLWYSIPNFLVISFIFYYFSRSYTATLAFGLGLITMLLTYEWKHYVAHRPLKPKTKFGKWIKKTHLLHHFKNENYWFGVSSPFLDIIFRTYKQEKEVQTSSTAKNLNA